MKLFALALAALLPCLAATQTEVAKGKALGNPSAPLMIEVYSDFQCPHCKVMHETILPSIIKDYVVTGKAYVISREFPLTGHPFAREAAAYATAAARFGKYAQVSDALFQHQADWSLNGKVWETVAAVLTPIEQKKIQALAKDPAILAEVQNDVNAGTASSINQTPTLIITHRLKRTPIVPQNYDLLHRYFDVLLTQ
jgi:protein-disulfide isomerase